jgi:hypothetical protein
MPPARYCPIALLPCTPDSLGIVASVTNPLDSIVKNYFLPEVNYLETSPNLIRAKGWTFSFSCQITNVILDTSDASITS